MAALLPIDLHHFEGAVVGYFMAYYWNVAIKFEFCKNYEATVNVNVGFQPHSSLYCFFVSTKRIYYAKMCVCMYECVTYKCHFC